MTCFTGVGILASSGVLRSISNLLSKIASKRLVKERNIAALYCLTVKVVGNDKIRRVAVKVEVQRLDAADPGVVGNVGDFVLTVGADKFPRVVK